MRLRSTGLSHHDYLDAPNWLGMANDRFPLTPSKSGHIPWPLIWIRGPRIVYCSNVFLYSHPLTNIRWITPCLTRNKDFDSSNQGCRAEHDFFSQTTLRHENIPALFYCSTKETRNPRFLCGLMQNIHRSNFISVLSQLTFNWSSLVHTGRMNGWIG